MFKLLYVLYKLKMLSPLGLYRLISSLIKYGINMMALLGIAERVYGDKTALVDDNETLSYRQLLFQSKMLSLMLKEKYGLKKGTKAAFLCKNHSCLVRSIFAVSALGADIYLLNAEMSRDQLNKLLGAYHFDLLVYDFEVASLVEQSNYDRDKLLSYHESLPAVNNLLDISIDGNHKFKRSSSGKLVILTGGTTGNPKAAAHKPSLFNYLNPFLTMLIRLKLSKYNTAYIATPIYHGYGVAILFLFTALGRKMVITKRFDAEKACSLIREHNVEVVTVVPLMLYKILKNNVEDLKSLACIASGGAELNPRLAEEVLNKLGNVLYNLYGTSEAGLSMVAKPEDLRYSARTIGKPLEGLRLKVLDDNGKEVEDEKVGQFCIKNKWSMKKAGRAWIETRDLGYRDDKGYYFLCGRADDMIVSAGENVYPVELEQILLKHPKVEDAAVIGIRDESFGQRLKAFVLLSKGTAITKEELFEWLHSRAARYQMPKEIVFVDDLPYTPLGKLDKKQLK